MIDVELVVTDLDGTLWPVPDDLHHRTRAALAELERRGVPLLVATGRRLRTTAVPLRSHGLAPPAIVLNGALGVDLATDERFHVASIPPAAAVEVLAAFRAAGLEPCVYVDQADADVYLSAGPPPSTHPGHIEVLGAWASFGDLGEVVATEPVLGFSVLGRPEAELAPVASAVAAGAFGIAHLDASIEFAGLHSLTVTGPGMSKWQGVLAYCAAAGLDPSKVLAVGDGINDLELLTGAAVAVVPEDANPQVRELAHHVVGCAIDGGWAEVLDLLE